MKLIVYLFPIVNSPPMIKFTGFHFLADSDNSNSM